MSASIPATAPLAVPVTVPILVIMGVAGSGKTTVAEILSDRLRWRLQEGDALHPRANVEKMASGTALTDEDRWPWLDRVAAWIDACEESHAPGIITCSALKRSYRDVLRRPGVTFVHLTGSRDTIAERLRRRQGHYMPPSLLASQLDTLEPLGEDEARLLVDVGASPKDEATEIIERLELQPAR